MVQIILHLLICRKHFIVWNHFQKDKSSTGDDEKSKKNLSFSRNNFQTAVRKEIHLPEAQNTNLKLTSPNHKSKTINTKGGLLEDVLGLEDTF